MVSLTDFEQDVEHVVLLDDDYEQIGTLSKDIAHTGETPLHLAFSLFLFDSRGRLLVQQRARSKMTWAGVWSNSCCGHPMLGEEIEDAVYRRTRYELGVELDAVECVLPHFRYRAFWNGIWENELCPVWVGFLEETPAHFEKSEVEAVDWVDWQAFAAASENPEGSEFAHFSPWSMMETRELLRSRRFRLLFEEFQSRSEQSTNSGQKGVGNVI
ncbi:isopentenyl-diphosphate Delta-isomerase [Pelagicoccus albus]|uniref:Isopentenyl-diphosphate delta-isomerase n=1 Tax=Pelagicoccus albus TaxID=415222 RepID=A0A7X1B7S9_9BACT|nr:isopentenyl-diphosphate Delta-isomerase [Pelagicoccus albus]MBC2607127.1 isopentenyl-diphosphate Delta-isomerase [Pelagicoccus albus]